jgi:glycosyltransferase involved in cell wall biosynthesis
MMKPTICQVLPALQAGGVERGTLDIAKAALAAGMGSIVVSSGGRLVAALEAVGSTHITLPMHSKNPFRMIANIFALKKIARAHQVSLLHARSRAPAWSAYFAAKALCLPFVTTYHGTYNGTRGLKKTYNSIMTKGDVVIAPSQFIKDHILRVHGAHLAPKIPVIPRGVDLKQFENTEAVIARGRALRAQWKIAPTDTLVLLPGRVTRWKGHEDVIRVIELIERPSIHVVFLGEVGVNQGFQAELIELIQSAGLSDNIHFQPHEADMAAAYAAADVVMAPSREPEAFGRVFAEAGAMERLVISTNHGGAAEVILPDQTGWLVEPNHPDALTEALEAFLNLPTEGRRKREQLASAHIRAHFSLQAMQEATIKVYGDLLRQS